MSEQPPPQSPQTSPEPLPVPPAVEPADQAASRPTRTLAGTIVILVVIVIAAAIALRGQTATTANYVGLSMLLFVTGALGVLVRRNALVMFMCVELMLNATNLAFVAFARMHGSVDGHVIVLFVIIVAAAEVAVGLAIIVSIFRRRHSTNVDDLSLLRG